MNLIKSRIFCVMLLVGGWLSCGNVLYAQQTINKKFPAEPLAERVHKISEAAKLEIAFEDSPAFNRIMAPAVDATHSTTEQALEKSMKGTGYAFHIKNNAIRIFKASLAAPPATTPDNPSSAVTGTVKGKVLDERGDLLPGATVKVMGQNKGTATDLDGDFELRLPPGTYTLEVGFLGYQTQRVTDVRVSANRSTPLDITLGVASTELAEVVVTATYNQASAQGLYARQKSIAAMSDGVSADLIKKTSDNNVAQVLKRVSGVTIDNGKYVTVRGMSERYNNVQLNGASLPSTEPNRRNFAFDVIPTGLVDNVTIAKTFTPDLPAEFTGGLVEVNTLAVPDKKMLNVTVGTGWNSISTGKDFLSNKRYKNDYFFGEINNRKWYAGPTMEEGKQSIINAGKMNTYVLEKYKAMPLQNYSITAGIPVQLGKSRLGLVAAITYRHEENREDILEVHTLKRDSTWREGSANYRFTTAIGAVGNVGWSMPGHTVTWRNLFNNRFSHRNMTRWMAESYGTYQSVAGMGSIDKLYEQYSNPVISSLWQTQLDGTHKLFDNKLIVSWNGSINNVRRTTPDDRLSSGLYLGETSDGKAFIEWTPTTAESNYLNLGEGHVMYNRLNEHKKNIGVNLEIPFVIQGNRQSIKTGYLGTFRDADYQQQYLRPWGDLFYGNPIISMSVGEYFSPEHFSAEKNPFTYLLSGVDEAGADYYTGNQKLHAAYLMGEFSFLKKVRFIAGARMEQNKMRVNTKYYKDIEAGYIDSLFTRNNTVWLPAATIIYSIMPELNIRAAYSKTLARPDFRELSFSKYYNVDDRVFVINRYPIEESVTHNYDLRTEWYPRTGEVVSVGFFHKKFIKPVEMITQMKSSQQDFDMFNMNLDEAASTGIEFNWRKSLGFVSPSTAFLNDLYFTGNYTLMKANVKYNRTLILIGSGISEEDKEKYQDHVRERPLQGLSPYAINMGLTYEGNRLGAALHYNRIGRKLVFAGDYTKDDQYENPRDVLDLQLSTRLLKEQLELKFNASDILNQDILVYRNRAARKGDMIEEDNDDRTSLGMEYNEGDWVMNRIRKGVNFSVSAAWRF